MYGTERRSGKCGPGRRGFSEGQRNGSERLTGDGRPKRRVYVKNSYINVEGFFLKSLTLVLIWLRLNPGGHFDTPVAQWPWWPIVVLIIVCLIID